MKNILIVIIIMAFTPLFAQVKYATFDGRDIKVYKNGDNVISFEILLLGDTRNDIYIDVSGGEELNDFKGKLRYLARKKIEFDSICILNNITDIDKHIRFGDEKYIVRFGEGISLVKPIGSYLRQNNKSSMIFFIPDTKSLGVKYIESGAGCIIFNNTSDIEHLMSLLNESNAEEFLRGLERNKSLLKLD